MQKSVNNKGFAFGRREVDKEGYIRMITVGTRYAPQRLMKQPFSLLLPNLTSST